MAEKIGFLDRITNRMAVFEGLSSAIIALMNSLFDLFDKLGEKCEILQQLPWWSQGAVSVLLVIIAVYLIRTAFAGKSRLLRPERFLIRPDEPRFLKGREHEVQELGQLCDREPLIFLDGESGCGKSALVCAGLLPWCQADPARPLPLRIDLSGAPWDNGIADLLGRTLWIEQDNLCRELYFKDYPQADVVFQVLIQIRARTARMPLLIFDQFDDYQTAYREHFYPAGGSGLLTSQEFLASNHFWSQIAQGVIAQHWHCLVVTRNDTRAGLDAIRFCDARSCTLSRIEQNLIAPLFDEITAPASDGAPIVDQPELGWNQLRERLLSDLASQEGQILPIQLAVSLDAIRRWRFLTVAQYRTQGGLPGLERLHVQGYVQETAHATGLSVATLIAVLLRLTDPARKKARRASFSELVQSLTGVSPDILRQALIMLEKRRIVRRVAHAEDTGGEAWLLYHDYLARGVMEAHRASDRWRLLLDEQARAWQRADGWREKWRFLLPLRTQARLAWEILRRQLRIGTYRRYIAWSLLRLTPVIILPVGLWTYNWWQLQQEMQIAQRTIAALDQDEAISNNEAEQFQLLIGKPWRAKQVALGYALANADASKRAVKHIEMLTHVLVGLDRTGERSKIIEKMSLDTLSSSKSAPDSRILAGRLLVQVRIAEPQAVLQAILKQINQMTKEVDLYAFEATLLTLKELFAKLDHQTTQNIHQNLLERMNTENESIKRQMLAMVLLALILNAKLEPKTTQAVPQDLLRRMKIEKNPYVLAALAPKLEPQTAQAAVQNLLEQINAEKDIIKRDDLFRGLQIFVLAAKLNPQTAQIIFQDLIKSLYTDTYINEERFSMLWELLIKLDQQAAQAVAQDLLKQTKTLKDPIKREKLVRTLKSTRSLAFAKLEPQIAQAIAQDLLEQINTEKNPSVILSIAQELLTLATELEPQDAHTITQNLLKWWKSEKGSIELTDIKALQTLATKLDPQAVQAIAKDLLRRLETTRQESERVLAYLIRAPQALAMKLDLQATQAVLQQKLLEQIKFEQDSLGLSDMVRVLLVLSPKLEPQTVKTIAQGLLNRMKTEKDSDLLNELVLALNALSAKLEPKTAQVAVQDLLEQMKTLKDPYVLQIIAIALKTIEKQSIKVNRPDFIIQLQSYVNVLKGYVGGIIECREAILDNIELMIAQKFDGDKWRFVEWATSKDAAKFHLDLD